MFYPRFLASKVESTFVGFGEFDVCFLSVAIFYVQGFFLIQQNAQYSVILLNIPLMFDGIILGN